MFYSDCKYNLPSQIVNGRLQFRYNLGSGEAVLLQNSIQVNDGRFHNVTVTRTERRAEIIIDGRYINRTTSSGSEVTLDIAADSMYLGASVDPQNGTAINGLSVCVTGFKLDRKEVPVGGENLGFVTLEISESIHSGCPIGSLFETPQPVEHIYTAIVVILIVLFITSGCFVVICMIVQWSRNRRGRHTLNFSRRSSIRRSWQARRAASPSQAGFQWQPATYKRDMSTPPGVYRSTPQHVPEAASSINMNNMNAADPYTDYIGTTNVPVSTTTETSFNDGSNRVSVRKPLQISPPQEGFTFSQANPGFQQESPRMSDREEQSEQRENEVRPSHIRSLSGHQSIRSTSTVATSILQDDTEVTKYLRKRLEVADSDIIELNLDEMKHYKEEGPYQSLGSVGSLFDFVRDLETDTKQRANEFQFPPESPMPKDREETPIHSHPLTNSHAPSNQQRTQPHGVTDLRQNKTLLNDEKQDSNKSRPRIHPLTGQRFEDGSEERIKGKFSSHDRSTEKQSHRETRKNGDRHSHSKRMENILERFHNITTGQRPMDEQEGRLV